VSICPSCEPENPAARYAATCVEHGVRDGLPVHYFDCERFNVTDYGTRQGKCDCTATADVTRLLDLVAEFRLRDKAATRVIEHLRDGSQPWPGGNTDLDGKPITTSASVPSCCCGTVPWDGKGLSYVAAGVVHRVGGPCYVIEATDDSDSAPSAQEREQ
jgi:hypothetical protein